MFQFIHAADVHLDSPLVGLARYEGAPVEEIALAGRRALENLVQLALDRRVAFVLIAGDLYDDDWKDHNTGLFFVRQMVRLREAGIPALLISGNHDAANKMTRALPLPDNVRSLSHVAAETILLPELGIDLDAAIHGQGFASARVTENVVRDYPLAKAGWFNIGLLHTSLEAAGDGEHQRYAPCSIDDLKSRGYQYWALGHIHKREIVAAGEPWIVYPGNLQGRHIRETGPKGCYLVTVDDRGQAQPEFYSLDVFRWERCDVDARGCAEPLDVLDRFAAALEQVIERADGLPLAVRVIVRGPCEAHRQLVAEQAEWVHKLRALALDAGAGSVWLEKVEIETSPARDLDEALDADGPLGELVGYLHEVGRDNGALAELAEQLADLGNKLPTELKEGPEAFLVNDPAQVRRLLDDVQGLLLARLGVGEGAE